MLYIYIYIIYIYIYIYMYRGEIRKLVAGEALLELFTAWAQYSGSFLLRYRL
jgi:hypothetical protein